jgi:GDPmannose 4,6-dehydratase
VVRPRDGERVRAGGGGSGLARRSAALTRALITGITGQDGSYLADLLLARGDEVHGLVRDAGAIAPNIEHVADQLTLHQGDLTDQDSLVGALAAARPDEIYNLAAASSVAASWKDPAGTGDASGLGVARLLEAVRTTCPHARVFHASSNEIFSGGGIANEETAVAPRTPYGAAKAYAHHLVIGFREAYGLFCCNGILFNHESPRRGLGFVTRKITHGAAAIKLGRAGELRLGTLEPQRDWGYAPDYVDAMPAMLRQERPRDYVLATGRARSIRDCVEVAFTHVGLDYREFVKLDEAFARPAEAEPLVGDASRARRELGWQPRTGFEEMIALMVEHDLALLTG